jgi:outer membrane lipoprotein SlyB
MLPALGPVIAGGLLASILASTAAGAAAGGLVGSLVGLGLSEENARSFEFEFARGRVIVTVRGGDRFDQASRTMLSHGATEVTASPAVTA